MKTCYWLLYVNWIKENKAVKIDDNKVFENDDRNKNKYKDGHDIYLQMREILKTKIPTDKFGRHVLMTVI